MTDEFIKEAIGTSTLARAIRGRALKVKKIGKTNLGAFLEGNKKTFDQINHMSQINPKKVRDAMALI